MLAKFPSVGVPMIICLSGLRCGSKDDEEQVVVVDEAAHHILR